MTASTGRAAASLEALKGSKGPEADMVTMGGKQTFPASAKSRIDYLKPDIRKRKMVDTALDQIQARTNLYAYVELPLLQDGHEWRYNAA